MQRNRGACDHHGREWCAGRGAGHRRHHGARISLRSRVQQLGAPPQRLTAAILPAAGQAGGDDGGPLRPCQTAIIANGASVWKRATLAVAISCLAGDAANAVLCAVGYNFQRILRLAENDLCSIFRAQLAALVASSSLNQLLDDRLPILGSRAHLFLTDCHVAGQLVLPDRQRVTAPVAHEGGRPRIAGHQHDMIMID